VLLGLNRLWDLRWPRERLLALGATLGADVPFFLGGGTAFVEGIGEILTPIDLPAGRWAVLKPAAALPTRKYFRASS
jgi:4-diphosphocytidyl-2-C-methyl-D-erythritol kinase